MRKFIFVKNDKRRKKREKNKIEVGLEEKLREDFLFRFCFLGPIMFCISLQL